MFTNTDYTNTLKAPVGYRTNRMIATTFSLEPQLVRMLSALFDPDLNAEVVARKTINTFSKDYTESDKKRLLVYYQQNRLSTTAVSCSEALSRLIEKCCISVKEQYTFHPKVILIEYVKNDGSLLHRLVVSSRNLTTAQNVTETQVVLEREADKLLSTEDIGIDKLIDYINTAKWDYSTVDPSFAPVGFKIAFQGKGANLYKTMGLDGQNSDKIILSPFYSLDTMKQSGMPLSNTTLYTTNDTEPLHSKIYCITEDGKSTLWVGSANCTAKGLRDNYECMAGLEFDKDISGDFMTWLNTIKAESVDLSADPTPTNIAPEKNDLLDFVNNTEFKVSAEAQKNGKFKVKLIAESGQNPAIPVGTKVALISESSDRHLHTENTFSDIPLRKLTTWFQLYNDDNSCIIKAEGNSEYEELILTGDKRFTSAKVTDLLPDFLSITNATGNNNPAGVTTTPYQNTDKVYEKLMKLYAAGAINYLRQIREMYYANRELVVPEAYDATIAILNSLLRNFPDERSVIDGYKGELSMARSFQRKTAKKIAHSFYVEGKNKMLLADEVGLGKTYVSRAVIELGKKIKDFKNSSVVPFNVIYIASNESIMKQNSDELAKGFGASVFKERFSEITKANYRLGYNIHSTSANIFFDKEDDTPGSASERAVICAYLKACCIAINNINDPDYQYMAQWYTYLLTAFCGPVNYTAEERNKNYNIWKSIVGDKLNGIGSLTPDEAKEFAKNLKEKLRDLDKEGKKNGKGKKKNPYYLIDIDDPKKYTKRHNYNRSGNIQPLDVGTANNYIDDFENQLLQYVKNTNISDRSDIFQPFIHELLHAFRKVLNSMNIKKYKPDLLILDEFHKFFTDEVRASLDIYLEDNPEMKVLFVSATPYKMKLVDYSLKSVYGLSDEDLTDTDSGRTSADDNVSCFNGYADLYKYLSSSNEETVSTDLGKLRTNLEKLGKETDSKKFEKIWKECIDLRESLEKALSKYIVRTERHNLTDIRQAETEETDDENNVDTFTFDAEQYAEVSKITGNNNLGMSYVKMCPYPLSFGDGYSTLRMDNNRAPDLSIISVDALWDGTTEPAHYRYQMLKSHAMNDYVKKALWIPPSKSEKNLGSFWKRLKDYTKTLSFATHKMTTRSVATIMSVQFDKTLKVSDQTIFDSKKAMEILESYKSGDESCKSGDESCIYEPAVCIYRAWKKHFDGEPDKKIIEGFYNYLKNNQHVLASAGVQDRDSLREYCKNGCLEDVFDEYFFVLNKFESNKDGSKYKEEITTALESYRSDSAKCYINNQGAVIPVPLENGFAIGANGDNVKDMQTIQKLFNSPFYPFVLILTPIAQEGINLHNYCHRIFHWRTPVSPIDFEQREGRINRFRGHSARKSLANELYDKSTDWYDVFAMAKKGNNGLSPDWIPITDKPVKQQSIICNNELSREKKVEQMLKDTVNNYRVSLGYGVSRETVLKITDCAETLGVRKRDFSEILIDLSPKN